MTYGKFNFKNGKVKNITQISISVTARVMDPVKFGFSVPVLLKF